MKLLRNPKIVAGLSVIAVMILVAQSGLLSLGSPSTSRPPKPMATPKRASLKVAAKPASSGTLALPTTSTAFQANRQSIQQAANAWFSNHLRDPFALPSFESEGDPASMSLSLSAIWRQSDRSLVVINQTILGLGDTIMDYQLVRVEDQTVWVEGPMGIEPITMGARPPKATDDAAQSPKSFPAIQPNPSSVVLRP
jgi:hypothetical protein